MAEPVAPRHLDRLGRQDPRPGRQNQPNVMYSTTITFMGNSDGGEDALPTQELSAAAVRSQEGCGEGQCLSSLRRGLHAQDISWRLEKAHQVVHGLTVRAAHICARALTCVCSLKSVLTLFSDAV